MAISTDGLTTEQMEALLNTTPHLGVARAIAARLGMPAPTRKELMARVTATPDTDRRGPPRA